MSKSKGIDMPQCTVQLWYNKQRVKKNGNVSLYLQLIIDCDHTEVPLKGLDWPADKIDWKKKKLLPRHDNDSDLLTYQAVLERERSKLWKVITGFILQDKSFTIADVFRQANLFRNGFMFCEFMEQAIRDRQVTKDKKDMIKESTARVHKSSLKCFQTFLNGNDIEISRLDDTVLKNFANYLMQGMTEDSAWVKIQNVKSYLSYAKRKKIAVNRDYELFTLRPGETDPVWLEREEMELLMRVYKERKLIPHLHNALRAFLFDCVVGMRISDLSRWSKDWIKGDYIVFTPRKQRKSVKKQRVVKIPIIPEARDFIADLEEETFQLPADQVYNRYLKEIAASAGIQKNLTSHVARHTFATALAMDGAPVLAISKMMGHKSIKTTDVYIHVAEHFLAMQMMKVKNRFGKKPPGEGGIRV